ncbi:MAG: hypothetical protein JNL57_02360 [Bacteroidetes bacterium]|nr:hypothetical protein [Bacteroidota bacterium]
MAKIAFNWQDYIDFAQELLEKDISEKSLRSSVSRAYYGAFICCRNRLGLSNRKDNEIHKIVCERFNSDNPTKEEMSIFNSLKDLRRFRNTADYENFCDFTPQQVALIVDKSKNVISLLNSIELD